MAEWSTLGGSAGIGSSQWVLAGSFLRPVSSGYVALLGFSSSDVGLSGGGGGLISKDSLVVASSSLNASILSMGVSAAAYTSFRSGISGTGAYLPMAFFTNGLERMRLLTGGQLLLGLPSTDLSLLAGAFVSADAICAVNGAVNASVISLGVTTGAGVDLSSGHSGSGTTLPMRFFINPNERMRLLTSGQLLIGMSSTDVAFANSGGMVSGDALVVATAASSASLITLGYAAGSYTALSSGRSGAGTFLPLTLWTSNTEALRITTGQILLAGLTSTDLSLSAGSIVSANVLASATASTNASTATLAAVAGSYAALTSGRSGAGTFLPLTLWTSNTEALRIDTAGLVGIRQPTPLADLHIKQNADLPSSPNAAGLLLEDSATSHVANLLYSNNDLLYFFVNSSSHYIYFSNQPAIHFDTGFVGGVGATISLAASATLAFTTGSTEAMRITSSQILLSGLTSTDASVNAGAIVSADTFVSVTASSNASLGSFAAIAGNYVAVSSSRTGTGTFLPLAFFTKNGERMRILAGATQPVLINRTTDDGTGAILQVSGNISVNGTVLTVP